MYKLKGDVMQDRVICFKVASEAFVTEMTWAQSKAVKALKLSIINNTTAVL